MNANKRECEGPKFSESQFRGCERQRVDGVFCVFHVFPVLFVFPNHSLAPAATENEMSSIISL